MRSRPIKTHAQDVRQGSRFEIGGWLHGKQTYLWMGDSAGCLGILDGPRLYRLAKAIVRQFERDKKVRKP